MQRLGGAGLGVNSGEVSREQRGARNLADLDGGAAGKSLLAAMASSSWLAEGWWTRRGAQLLGRAGDEVVGALFSRRHGREFVLVLVAGG